MNIKSQPGSLIIRDSLKEISMNKLKIGDIVYLHNEDKQDVHEKPEMVLVIKAFSEPREEMSFLSFEPITYDSVGLCLDSGRQRSFLSTECDKASSKDINARLEKVKAAHAKMRAQPYLQPNSLAQLKYRHTHIQRTIFYMISEEIERGTTVVIDMNSTLQYADGKVLKDEATDPQEKEEMEKNLAKQIGSYRLVDLVFPHLKVYIPAIDKVISLPPEKLEAKVFDPDIDKKLVLPEGYIARVFRTLNRVLNPVLHDTIYNKLGLSGISQKGRGAIFLLYGPPGTGKTMTAEVVAEKLQRPLLRVNIGNLFNAEAVVQKLEASFKKAKKYNAVLLLDEIDVFIRKRGDNPLFDENTATFLRTLELFDGILFMTTNLVGTIDKAIFSRVHVVLEYSKQTEEDRRVIWKTMMKYSLLQHVVGSEATHEKLFDELSKIALNGREIKTAIQNAVTHAISELRGKEVPSVKWIPRQYFITEANEIAKQRDELQGGIGS